MIKFKIYNRLLIPLLFTLSRRTAAQMNQGSTNCIQIG